jgi:FkbM family methyltransferase
LRAPIYLGSNRAVAFLESGEPIVVDTTTIDSLNYILGHPIEQDVFPVFRRLLRYDSVVVDIGANFGYYTLRAAPFVLPKGEIYSFEGNPHTFGYLNSSLYANQIRNHPKVHSFNILIHDAPGEAEIRYKIHSLGLASMWDNSEIDDPDYRACTVETAGLDDLLPQSVIVDVVKMDVQGSEPYALRGMQKILARSPNIKIITEFHVRYLDKSFGAHKFQKYIADLGLLMWRIGAGGELTEVKPDTPLKGDNYCLLARSLDAKQLDGHEIVVDLNSLQIKPIYSDDQNPILLQDGISYNASRHGHITENVLFYGPYINLEPGHYELILDAKVSGEFIIQIAQDFGELVTQFPIKEFTRAYPFTLRSPARKFEIVLSRTGSSQAIDVASMRLRKM